MRNSLLALLAVLALFASACGASGDDDAADDPTSTSASSATSEAATDDTEPEEGESSGDPVEVEAWAADFCSSFETWLNGITAAGEDVGDAITPGDLEGAKRAIVGLFDDVSGQTQTLIDEIEAGGAPDIDDGESFQSDLLGKFEDFNAAIEVAKSEAEGVSTADPAAFQATITELVSTFQTETQTVGDSFSELDAEYGDADLDAAVRDACTFM